MLQTGAVIGILGGGQLGRMLAIAAAQLGFKTHIYTPKVLSSASQIADAHTHAAYEDEKALEKFAQQVDVVSFEFENIPLQTAEFLSQRVDFFPQPKALALTQDRVIEKSFLNDLGIATVLWSDGNNLDEIEPPVIVKTRKLGYDGKGQIKAQTIKEIKQAQIALKAPIIIEQQAQLQHELALCAARSQQGEMVFYDLVETDHMMGILHKAYVPAKSSLIFYEQAIEIARKIAESLDYVGVLVVEMFEVNGKLLVNEVAPRVHNSAHWTIEACLPSQFTQHIRALAGWSLLPPQRFADAVMTNIIGKDSWQEYINQPNTAIHLYNKGEARAGRKMGHITQIFSLSLEN